MAGQGAVASSFECGNETSDFIKYEKSLDQLSKY
jgi:hypothetical protein